MTPASYAAGHLVATRQTDHFLPTRLPPAITAAQPANRWQASRRLMKDDESVCMVGVFIARAEA
jgi:hypothetical protein